MSSAAPSYLPRSPRSYDLSFDASSSTSTLYRNDSNDSSTSSPTSPTALDHIRVSNGPSTPPPSYAFPAHQHQLPSYSQRAASLYLLSTSPKKQQHLSDSLSLSISDALEDQVKSEIAQREERRREVLIRAKLEPLLFPAPVPFGRVLKGMFGAGKREKVAERKRYENEGKHQLTREELEVGKRMVEEYWAGLDRAA